MSNGMLNTEQAAHYLGVSMRSLQRIVARSKRRAAGLPVDGPVITYAQLGDHGAIRFKPEWLEEFIRRSTVIPQAKPLITPIGGHKRRGIRAIS
jgi:hypothetical protein